MSSAQSPLLWVPLRTTTDVSYSHSLRSTIAQIYQESPDTYKEEISTLDRCRQDALRGSAGSDATGRDLLYKYFGQLELLELRFPEVRVPFPWKDAFTGKEISQLSLAYEKASVIFNIGATLSSLAAQQNRSSPEGLKRAFHNFRCAAGMFTYINDNFLHAPSTDLSREVVKVLVTLMVAQATEVFVERLTEEKKGAGLRARVSTQAASLYAGIVEETKDLVSKGVFDRSWTWLVQTKHKYFVSLAQYQRSLADAAASKHGDALSRLTIAEAAAKDAARLATSFSASLHSVNSMSMLGTTLVTNPSATTMPSDAGSALTELTKSHLAICTQGKTQAAKDNDLIYHEAVSSEASLPPIERSSVADPIPIQEVYGAPEVQKVVGQDIFIRLVPLSVHESASLYSEEKAKLVRTEGERCDVADSELSAALEYMGLPASLDKFRDGAGSDGSRWDALAEPPTQVKEWAEEIRRASPPLDALFREIEDLRASSSRDLDSMSHDLDTEHRECEQLRVKYGHLWEQTPSIGATRGFRGEIRSHREALDQAKQSDDQVAQLWQSLRPDVGVLGDPSGEAVERLFAETLAAGASSSANGASLLDLDATADDADKEEASALKRNIKAIEEGLSRLQSLKKERQGVFRDLKERIQTDDISQLLILNRKSSNIEPALFAAELEKFRPHSGRIAATVHHQSLTLQDVTARYRQLTEGKKAKEVQDRWAKATKRRKELVGRLQRARDGHEEVRVGLGKGLSFYRELADVISRLRKQVSGFIGQRNAERTEMIRTAEVRQRLEGGGGGGGRADSMSPVSAATPAPAIQTLEQQVRTMDLGSSTGPGLPAVQKRVSSASWQPPPHVPQSPIRTHADGLPPPPSPPVAASYQSFPLPPSNQPSYASYPPPPPKPQPKPAQSYQSPPPPPVDPYAGLESFGNSFSSAPPPPASAPAPAPAPAPSAYRPPTTAYSQHALPSPYGGTPQPPRPPQHRDSFPPPPSAQSYHSHVASPAPPPHPGYSSPPPAQPSPYQSFTSQPAPASSTAPTYGRGLPPPPPHAPTTHWQPSSGQYSYSQPPPPQGSSGQRYSGPLPPPPAQPQQHSAPYALPPKPAAYGYPQQSQPQPHHPPPAPAPHAQYYQQPPPPPPQQQQQQQQYGGYASPPPQQPQYGQQPYSRPPY